MTRYRSFLAGQTWSSRAFYVVARAAAVGFSRGWTRATIEGREHVPASGPCVLAPVHRSNIDTPLTAAVTRRRVRFMGKDSLWKKPMWAWLFSSLGGFPVSRGATVDLEAMKRCLEVLELGEPLVLFPEGERKSGPLVHPLFEGAAYLALKAAVPIVPIGIGGSERVMPRGARLIRPAKVHIVVGEVLTPAPVAGRVPRAQVEELTAELHDRLQVLFDRAQVVAGG